jgi:DNA-binding MarR family transcriptional regulator
MHPTTSAARAVMVRGGWGARRRLPRNRRSVHVFLTARGRALQAILVPLAIEVNAVAMSGVTPSDVRATRRTLLRMLENLGAQAERDAARAAPPPSARRPPMVEERARGKAK